MAPDDLDSFVARLPCQDQSKAKIWIRRAQANRFDWWNFRYAFEEEPLRKMLEPDDGPRLCDLIATDQKGKTRFLSEMQHAED